MIAFLKTGKILIGSLFGQPVAKAISIDNNITQCQHMISMCRVQMPFPFINCRHYLSFLLNVLAIIPACSSLGDGRLFVVISAAICQFARLTHVWVSCRSGDCPPRKKQARAHTSSSGWAPDKTGPKTFYLRRLFPQSSQPDWVIFSTDLKLLPVMIQVLARRMCWTIC